MVGFQKLLTSRYPHHIRKYDVTCNMYVHIYIYTVYGKLHVVIALSDCMFVKNERTNVASYLKVGGSGGSHG